MALTVSGELDITNSFSEAAAGGGVFGKFLTASASAALDGIEVSACSAATVGGGMAFVYGPSVVPIGTSPRLNLTSVKVDSCVATRVGGTRCFYFIRLRAHRRGSRKR